MYIYLSYFFSSFFSELTLSNLPPCCSVLLSRSVFRHHQLRPRACHEQGLVNYDRVLGCCRWTGGWNTVFWCLQTIVAYLSGVLKKQSNTFDSRLFTQEEGNKLVVTILMNSLAGCRAARIATGWENATERDLLKNVLLTRLHCRGKMGESFPSSLGIRSSVSGEVWLQLKGFS